MPEMQAPLELPEPEQPQQLTEANCLATITVTFTTKSTTKSWCQSITGSCNWKLRPRNQSTTTMDCRTLNESLKHNETTEMVTTEMEMAEMEMVEKERKRIRTTTTTTMEAMVTETFPSLSTNQATKSQKLNNNKNHSSNSSQDFPTFH